MTIAPPSRWRIGGDRLERALLALLPAEPAGPLRQPEATDDEIRQEFAQGQPTHELADALEGLEAIPLVEVRLQFQLEAIRFWARAGELGLASLDDLGAIVERLRPSIFTDEQAHEATSALMRLRAACASPRLEASAWTVLTLLVQLPEPLGPAELFSDEVRALANTLQFPAYIDDASLSAFFKALDNSQTLTALLAPLSKRAARGGLRLQNMLDALRMWARAVEIGLRPARAADAPSALELLQPLLKTEAEKLEAVRILLRLACASAELGAG